jgi:hypothetical protein
MITDSQMQRLSILARDVDYKVMRAFAAITIEHGHASYIVSNNTVGYNAAVAALRQLKKQQIATSNLSHE